MFYKLLYFKTDKVLFYNIFFINKEHLFSPFTLICRITLKYVFLVMEYHLPKERLRKRWRSDLIIVTES